MARGVMPRFVGHLPVFEVQDEAEDRSDFRNVPASDRGNADYSDRGMLGSYTPTQEPYASPSDVKFMAGYGATVEDLKRGYNEPMMREDAAYDLANYKDRSTLPKAPDVDDNEITLGSTDRDFRARNERSRGFFTRPRIPTDR